MEKAALGAHEDGWRLVTGVRRGIRKRQFGKVKPVCLHFLESEAQRAK